MPRAAVPLLLAALALVPARASAAVPVAIHPFKVPGLVGTQPAELHALLQAGLATGVRRGVLEPRSPTLLPPSTCGDWQTPQCLAAHARGGLILAGRGEVRRGVVLVTAALWDSNGHRTHEVRFAVDLVIENLRPITEALIQLEAAVEQDGSVTPANDGASAPTAASPSPPRSGGEGRGEGPGRAAAAAPASPAGKAAPIAVPLPPPPVPRPLSVTAPAPAPAGAWRRTAGPWLLGGGLALVAGGATVGLLNKQRADDLDAKYARGTLAASDHSRYQQVKRDNVISTALFAAGGVACAAGAWIWIGAPAAGQPMVAGVGGRY